MSAPVPLKTYDLAAVFLTIGGYRMGGYGEEGGIEFEYGSDVGEGTVGADGQGTFSRNNDDSMTATITLMETSKSYRDLAALYVTQAAQTPIEALSFRMSDAINGDKVTDGYCSFLAIPAPSKGKGVGEREFKLWLPNGRKNIQLGVNVAI